MSRQPPERRPEVGPRVIVDDERATGSPNHAVDVDRWAGLVADVLAAEGLGDRPVEVHVHFVDESAMEDLNREHMGGEGPTDVLAFPVDDPAEGPGDLPVLLGDVVICPVVAARQAQGSEGCTDGSQVRGGLKGELSLLLVHGILHLLGHDHAEAGEREVMQRRERELLAGFGR